MEEGAKKRSVGIPDITTELYKNQVENETRSTDCIPPPVSTTECLVTEVRNSDPNFLRSTFYVLPSSEYCLESSGLPLGIVVTPFNEKGLIANIEDTMRCPECHSYVNCNTKQQSPNLVCSICDKVIGPPVSENLAALSLASFETQSLDAKKETALVFVFDFSFPFVSQMVQYAASLCKNEAFKNLYSRVGFVEINDGISFYTVSSSKKIIRTKILGKGSRLSLTAFISSSDAESIAGILDEISSHSINMKPNLLEDFFDILAPLSEYFAGIKVAVISASYLPSYDYESFLSSVKNIVINVISLSTEAKESGGKGNNLMNLAFSTGGRVALFRRSELACMFLELQRVVLSRCMFNVVAQIKVSDNLVKTDMISPALDESISFLHLNGMSPQDSITFQLSLTGLSKRDKYCQVIVSYNSNDGYRCTRVFNHAFATGSPNEFFLGLSFDTIFAVLVKLAIKNGSDIGSTLVKALSLYREKCASKSLSSQLILPESLKCLPVLVQAFSKKTRLDKSRLVRIGVEETLRYFYPRLLSLLDFSTSSFLLSHTHSIRLSAGRLEETEIYVLENGQEIYVYVSGQVEQQVIDTFFCPFDDPQAAASLAVYGPSLSLRDAEQEDAAEASSLLLLVKAIMAHYGKEMPIRVFVAGSDPDEAHFAGCMVEDAINNMPDFVDYIFKLHFKIRRS